MSDEQAAIDHWRRGCAEIRRAEFLAPERLAGLGVKTRKNTVDSEGANPAVGDHGRRFDSLTVADGRWVHGIGGGIAFLPDYLPDRKSTRLNSSHGSISYAVFCLKKKKKINRYKNYLNS